MNSKTISYTYGNIVSICGSYVIAFCSEVLALCVVGKQMAVVYFDFSKFIDIIYFTSKTDEI